jgi:hypothetical protein
MPLRFTFNGKERGMDPELLLTGVVLILALRATTTRR